jgi:hypothetical protein
MGGPSELGRLGAKGIAAEPDKGIWNAIPLHCQHQCDNINCKATEPVRTCLLSYSITKVHKVARWAFAMHLDTRSAGMTHMSHKKPIDQLG